jgi:hypothetical protein
MGNDVDGSGCGLFEGTIPAFAWRYCGKLRKPLARIVDLQAEI